MDVGVDSRGECMVEERHYVEEPAFILNRGICGRHARNGRGYRMSVTIESFALDKIQSSVVVKLFCESPNWQISDPVCGGRCLFFRGAV